MFTQEFFDTLLADRKVDPRQWCLGHEALLPVSSFTDSPTLCRRCEAGIQARRKRARKAQARFKARHPDYQKTYRFVLSDLRTK